MFYTLDDSAVFSASAHNAQMTTEINTTTLRKWQMHHVYTGICDNIILRAWIIDWMDVILNYYDTRINKLPKTPAYAMYHGRSTSHSNIYDH